jgi:4-amino-4-deoxy-L-arabinose transferase-like glycosyltransferase
VSRLAAAVRSPLVRVRASRVEARRPGRTFALLRRVPTAAWVCALIALLNAATWSLIVPPFEGKDESDHFAYVEQIVENGSLPENGQENGNYSNQEDLVLAGLHADEVLHSPQHTSITSEGEQRALIEANDAGASLRGSGEAGIATSEPPLYYAIQAVPYLLARGNILLELQLMRLVGALFGAVTALFTFLFLREILPRSPWAATVGALAVALQPLLGFMSGSVNPDSMLFAVSAAVIYCVARAFRRGLTRRLALALGVGIAAGFLTKLNFIGLAFGVYVGLAVLAVREVRARGRVALQAPLLAAAIGVLPVGLYALRNALESHHTLGLASSGASLVSPNKLWPMISYIWQFYLPRIPGMTHFFDGLATYKDIWFDRSVGLYGWMDTMFASWVNNVALVPAALVAVLFVREVAVRRKALRRRLPELGVYAAIAFGLLVLIGGSSYDSDALNHNPAFAEPRYLLPLLPLLGAVFTLAVRGAGRRWAPAVGTALIVLIFGFDVFSQLQVIARYYG